MRKTLAALAVATVATIAGGSLASAYPPDDVVLTLSPSTVGPGDGFTATLTGCLAGETVNFAVAGDATAATCSASGGGTARAVSAQAGTGASATLTAPSAAGEYTVSARGATSGVGDTATLTVAVETAAGGGALPATGSDAFPTVQVAGGALVAGLGLSAVAWRRRRAHAA